MGRSVVTADCTSPATLTGWVGRCRSSASTLDSDKKIAHQTVHPPRLAFHDAQKTFTRGRVVLGRTAQGFDEPDQRGQRRAQLMADVGDKITSELADLFLFGDILKRAERAVQRLRPDTGVTVT